VGPKSERRTGSLDMEARGGGLGVLFLGKTVTFKEEIAKRYGWTRSESHNPYQPGVGVGDNRRERPGSFEGSHK